MTESEENAEPVQDLDATALLILHPLEGPGGPHAGQARAELLDALAQFGFLCGPVVGDICAVTGRGTQVQALKDHAQVMHHRQPVEGANEQLLALMRPALIQIVEDEAAEPFPDEADESTIHDTHLPLDERTPDGDDTF